MTEKWVAVELYSDYSGVIDIHGIFESEDLAAFWASEHLARDCFVIRRIKKAIREIWA